MPDPANPAEEQDTSYVIPARLDGFTPVVDEVVRDLGTTAAIVYGVVLRHSFMYHQQCEASQATMAALTGLADRTIRKWLKALEDEKYIRAIATPQGRPTVYVPTDKVKFEFNITAGRSRTPAPRSGVKNQAPALDAKTPAPRSDKETKKTQLSVTWNNVLVELYMANRTTYTLWLSGSELLQCTAERATIRVRDDTAVEMCANRLRTPITRTLAGVVGDGWAGVVEFVTDEEETE